MDYLQKALICPECRKKTLMDFAKVRYCCNCNYNYEKGKENETK